jgi:hypothetical protein
MMTPLSPRQVIAIGVSVDKPAVDSARHIAVLNAAREEMGCPYIRNHQSATRRHSTVAMILLVVLPSPWLI